jgi:hypothetical protein
MPWLGTDLDGLEAGASTLGRVAVSLESRPIYHPTGYSQAANCAVGSQLSRLSIGQYRERPLSEKKYCSGRGRVRRQRRAVGNLESGNAKPNRASKPGSGRESLTRRRALKGCCLQRRLELQPPTLNLQVCRHIGGCYLRNGGRAVPMLAADLRVAEVTNQFRPAGESRGFCFSQPSPLGKP